MTLEQIVKQSQGEQYVYPDARICGAESSIAEEKESINKSMTYSLFLYIM